MGNSAFSSRRQFVHTRVPLSGGVLPAMACSRGDDLPERLLRLAAPGGGERREGGEVLTIWWMSTNIRARHIDFSPDGGQTFTCPGHLSIFGPTGCFAFGTAGQDLPELPTAYRPDSRELTIFLKPEANSTC